MPLPGADSRRSRTLAATDRVLPPKPPRRKPPAWPSGHEPTEAEARLWSRMWSLPQGVAWRELPGVAEVVERYCRVSVRTSADLDAGEVKAATLAQLRSLEGDLGLTPAGMARLRWRIGETPPTRAKSGPPVMRPRRMRPPDYKPDPPPSK